MNYGHSHQPNLTSLNYELWSYYNLISRNFLVNMKFLKSKKISENQFDHAHHTKKSKESTPQNW